ncbi:MAG: nucleotide exchange factor GrpE [Firmicutes bacterium]|nr:nucleotide exchange factor GrpE [Bacillota bacterium]
MVEELDNASGAAEAALERTLDQGGVQAESTESVGSVGSAESVKSQESQEFRKSQNEQGEACEGELARLMEELERVKQERDKYLAGWQRTQADFENFKKRARQEKEELSTVVVEETVLKVLPIIDNLERALAFSRAKNDAEPLISGVELTLRQFMDTLAREGITPIEAKDKSFDPRFHEAMMQVESDGAAENTVVEEIQRGYRSRTRVLRPSLVKVSRRPESGLESGLESGKEA